MKTNTNMIQHKKTTLSLAAAALAGLAFTSPSALAVVRYWDAASSGSFGSISTVSISWVSPLNIIWTNSNTGGTSRLQNYTTTLTDDCTWGGPTAALGGGTVPVGTVNAGTLSFLTINGSGTVILSGGTITLAPATSLTALTSTQTHTISSTLAGAATSLTKLGVGTIVLSGSNTYTGSTIVSAGTLTLGNSLALQNSVLDTTSSIAGTASSGLRTTVATLTLGGISGNQDLSSLFTTNAGGYSSVTSLTLKPAVAVTNTYSGAIAEGAVGMTLTKSGLGTQVLAGANSFTGGTTVISGTLTLDYSSADNSKLSDTGVLVLGSGTIELSGGTHTEVVASTTLTGASRITRSSGAAKLAMGGITGAGTIDFAAGGIATTTNANDASGILGSFATVASADWAANDGSGTIVAYTGYADVNARGVSTIANGANTNVRILGDGTSGNVELGAATTTINTLLQSNPNFAPVINTAGKTLATNVIVLVPGAESLSVGVAPGDGTLQTAVSGGTLALTTSNAAKILTINAGIADNGGSGLIKGGPGTVVLAGASTYTGATIIAEGTLNFSGSLLTSSIAVSTNAVLSEGSTGSIGGAATLTHDSTSTSTLAGANTYSGATVINNGVVNIQNGAALGSTAAGTSVASGAALQIQGDITVGDEALTLSGSGISNTGALRSISGNNTFGGLVTLGGTAQISSDAGTLTLSNPGIITGSSFSMTFAGSGNTIVNSIIGTGSGLLSKEGTGRLTLTGANTFTNTVTVSAGVLNIQNATATGTTAGGVIVTDGAALEIQGDITVGAEALALNGFGIANGGALLNVSGNNTWGGALTISTTTSRINSDAGTLTIDVPSGSAITGTGVAVPNPNMIFGGSGNITVADPIATGSGTLTKDGSGTLTLSGTNTYTGATAVTAGVLKLGAAGALGTGTTKTSGVTVSNLASLDLNSITPTATVALNLNGTTAAPTVGALTNSTGTAATWAGTVTLQTNSSVGGDSGDIVLSNTVTGSAFGLTKVGADTLTLSAAQNYATLTTNGGTTNVNGALGTGTSTVNANATTNFGVSQTMAALNIGAGAVVTLMATPPFAPLADGALSGPSSAVVPEPGSIGLLLVGSLGLLARRRRHA